MMKSAIIFSLAAIAIGCNNAQPVQNTASPASEPQRAEKPQTVTAHTTENLPPKMPESGVPGGNSKWSQGGEPIDTARFDGVIAAAEKTVKAKPTDDEAKKTLAQAYFDRGVALTDARQYASALGDYRRALKNDPNHEDAKKWIEIIVGIYVNSVKKDPPKEGEEPPPLPFKK